MPVLRRRTAARASSCDIAFRIVIDAVYAFGEDDGWALASHIALSALLALFPFLIVLTALAGFAGSKDIADNLATLLLETWPSEVAEPLAREIHNVLDHDARRRAHHRRGAVGLFRVERRRQPAHRAQPRLQRDRDALDLAAEARIDRLCAGRGLALLGARVPDRAGAARYSPPGSSTRRGSRRWSSSSPTGATASPAP